jgi:hypothetical protein
MKSKHTKSKSLADQIVADAKKESDTLEGQLEVVRFWRDVNARGNLEAQFACATAIDKLKGLYS